MSPCCGATGSRRSTKARASWPRRSGATKACRSFACCRSRRAKARRRAQLPPTRLRAQATSVGGFEIVVVKWFNRARGFGFLTRGEGTEDIFVHMETLRRYGFADPQPGDTMLARFGPGPKGLLAAEVRPLDGGRGHSSH